MAVMESCVEVTESFAMSHPSVLGGETDRGAIEEFAGLDTRQQFMYATFIDWFYNRVLRDDVLVPYNFCSPIEWNDFFCEFDGIRVLDTYGEGFDQDTAPEFHTLHVLTKT